MIAIVIVGVATFFGFTRYNPFADPYELTATFESANNLKPKSPVRDRRRRGRQGQEGRADRRGSGAARVTMEIEEAGLPIHKDAQLKIRPRIFLEGNFFVDIQPGTPSAPRARRRATAIPVAADRRRRCSSARC